MKPLGIVRSIDALGRVVIPKEVRTTEGWTTGQPLEMFKDKDGSLIIKAYSLGETDETVRKLEAKKNFTVDAKKRKAYDIVINDLKA